MGTSGTLFDVLQIPMSFGRGLTRDDESMTRPPVAGISEQLWRERLGGDPGVPLRHVIDAAVETRRYQTSLFTAFAASALLIALVGVYATTAYGVSRRRRELNIRIALGARASQVFALVLRQSVVPVGIGLAGGFAGALAVGGAIASLLYEVRPRDPLVLSVVLSLVAVVAMASAVAATLGSLHIEPASVLREE